MSDELTKVAEDSARGGFFLISGTAIATVIMAIASILIARFLGPELYGQYALILVIPQLLFHIHRPRHKPGHNKIHSKLKL